MWPQIQAAASRLSVCRTWAFNDGGTQALQISPGVYDERVFQVPALPEILFFFFLPFICIFNLLTFFILKCENKYSGTGLCDIGSKKEWGSVDIEFEQQLQRLWRKASVRELG